MPRPIHEIAADIIESWPNVNYAARPYLDAMLQLSSMRDSLGYDSARSIVLYFLNNAKTWRGPAAQRIKAELKALLSQRNPVKIRKLDHKYQVSHDGRITAKATSKRKAAAQARLLRAVDHGWKPTGRRNPSVCYICERDVPLERIQVGSETVDVCAHCRRGLETGEHLPQPEAVAANPAAMLMNPPARLTKIYNRVIEMKASKAGMPHQCDPKCRAAGHRYVHRFSSKACVWGLPDGRILIGE